MSDALSDYLRLMDAAGVDKSCINCINFGEARRGNDRVARFLSSHPDRFVGVAYVTPRYPDEALSELERCFDVLGFRSLKLYPTYLNKPIDHPSYDPIFEWADERSIVIMSHSSYTSDDDQLTRPDPLHRAGPPLPADQLGTGPLRQYTPGPGAGRGGR